MRSRMIGMVSACLLVALAARASAEPPATADGLPVFPGSVLLSDDKSQFGPTMTRLDRKYSTERPASEVLDFFKKRLATNPERAYSAAAALAPGGVSGVLTMAGTTGSRLLWSAKDAAGSTSTFALEIVDQSGQTQITLNVTITAAAAAKGTGQTAGLVQLGQKAQSQTAAVQQAVNTAEAQDLLGTAKTGTPKQVQATLDAGAKITDRDLTGNTALMIAAASNPDPAVLTLLLKAGAGINETDSLGETALMFAASNSTAEIVSTLLSAGAKVQPETVPGATALYLSAFNPHPGVVTALVRAGADVHLRLASLSQTPLLAAVQARNLVAVQELLKVGAASDLKGPDGPRALADAVTNPKLETLQALIKAGADVNAKDTDRVPRRSWTPPPQRWMIRRSTDCSWMPGRGSTRPTRSERAH